MVDAIKELVQGREAYARRAWMDAYELLSHADQATPLGAKDLELLATSAYMIGRDDDFLGEALQGLVVGLRSRAPGEIEFSIDIIERIRAVRQ